jgi:tetratricopeptide (TPR) repeat protein
VLAFALARAGNPTGAANALGNWAEALPADPHVPWESGKLHEICGRADLAIHAFERALELLGDADQDLDLAGDCLIRLARAHRSLGDLAAAEHCVERLLAFDTQQPEVHLEHAWIAFDHGHMDLAVERAQRARALLRPEHGDLAIYVTQSLGYALAELGRRDEARRELEAFLAARPDDRPASAFLAAIIGPPTGSPRRNAGDA